MHPILIKALNDLLSEYCELWYWCVLGRAGEGRGQRSEVRGQNRSGAQRFDCEKY